MLRCHRAIYLYISSTVVYDGDESILSLLKKHANYDLYVGVMTKGSRLHKHFVQRMSIAK